MIIWLKGKKRYYIEVFHDTATECHLPYGSQSVTCYPTQVNTPHLNPSHEGRYSIYLPRSDERLSWPSWLDSAQAGSWTSDLSITSPTLNHCTTKTTKTNNLHTFCSFCRLDSVLASNEKSYHWHSQCSQWSCSQLPQLKIISRKTA